MFLVGFTLKIGLKVFMIDSVSKNNTGTYKTEDFNDEKITYSFWEIELFLSKLKMSYYPEPSSYIGDKVITFATLCY